MEEVNYKKYIVILVIIILCLFNYSAYLKFKNNSLNYMNKQKEEVIEPKKEETKIVSNSQENYHNSVKLNITSAYGDNDAFHPKVLYFKEKWNGYKYWMAFSPYPKGNDAKENPHIKVSNDLINFTEPNGFKNPLEGAPTNHRMGTIYNSDPHLVYNNDTDTLECYYRYVNDALDKVVIYRLTTKDGVNWSDKEAILTSKRSSNDYLSPAIIYDNGIYKFWSIDKDRKVKYMESVDGYNYKEIRTINLKYQLKSLKNWHMDVIKHDNIYEMIAVAYNNWDDRLSMNLYYFKSNDNINYTDAKIILRPSVNSWDNRGIYRSSFIYVDGVYYLYYSAMSSSLERGIGLSYGKDINNLKGFDGENIDL